MNIMKLFNDTIDYLETVLDDEIDEKKVAYLSGYSSDVQPIVFNTDRNNSFRIFKKQKADRGCHCFERYGRKDNRCCI